MNWWYLSSDSMTVSVATDSAHNVVKMPAIVAKFYGQPFGQLVSWMRKQSNFTYQQLEEPPHADTLSGVCSKDT